MIRCLVTGRLHDMPQARTAQSSPGVAVADSAGGCAGIRWLAVARCDPRYRGDASELTREKR